MLRINGYTKPRIMDNIHDMSMIRNVNSYYHLHVMILLISRSEVWNKKKNTKDKFIGQIVFRLGIIK